MKRLRTIYICLVILWPLSLFQTANAQIWKKIKKKTQEKVGRIVSDKASDKAAEMAAKNMDKILNADINPFGKGSKKEDVSDLPQSYSFEWKYQLQMEAQEKGSMHKMAIDYYISPGNPYFGFSMPQMPSMFTVMDTKNNTMVAYMEQGSQPIGMAYNLPESDSLADAKEAHDLNDYTITKLPDKKFMGFNCQGLQLENTKYRVILYYTTEAGVSFSQVAKSNKTELPPKLQKYLGNKSQGLMTYMKVINKKDTGNNMIMRGISLDKTILVKNNLNYKFM